MKALERIGAETLDRPIQGRRLTGGTLREECGGTRTLFCFLRHLG